jgi:hypothetical protein
MGRSFASVRLELNGVAERWARTAQHLTEDHRAPGKMLAGWAKYHSSEAFFGCNGPVEAVLFSVLVEMHRQQNQRRDTAGEDTGAGITGGDGNVDP